MAGSVHAGVSKRADLRTPCLIIERRAFDSNIRAMAARAAKQNWKMRPHAKSHKSVDIARQLAAAGALGPACATIGEAEAMAAAGLGGILITSPVATADNLARLSRLLRRDADIMVVTDDPDNVKVLDSTAKMAGRNLGCLVEIDVGQGRTGCVTLDQASTVARHIADSPALTFAGIQAYWGHLQQVMPYDERQRRAEAGGEKVKAAFNVLSDAGLKPGIVTGGGTGTSGIDAGVAPFTELQPGSFLFLDSCYGSIALVEDGPNPFAPSLFLRSQVVSRCHPNRVIVNAGFKAFATDSGKPVPHRGAPAGATYRYMGDEHGAVEWEGDAPAPALGDAIELLTSHCDPTVNLHRAYNVVDGDDVIDVWPIENGYF
jgi:D-serine deaminase-like pyridoxal phosphate-dependent protein